MTNTESPGANIKSVGLAALPYVHGIQSAAIVQTAVSIEIVLFIALIFRGYTIAVLPGVASAVQM